MTQDDVPYAIDHPDRPRPTVWPDPTPALLDWPQFEAVWQCIKSWDINVPDAYAGHCGATGNHVRAILDALAPFLPFSYGCRQPTLFAPLSSRPCSPSQRVTMRVSAWIIMIIHARHVCPTVPMLAFMAEVTCVMGHGAHLSIVDR